MQCAEGAASVTIPDDGTRAERVAGILDKVTKAVEKKHKIEESQNITMTPEQVSLFLTLMGAAIAKHVGDTNIVARIGTELKVLIHAQSSK